jgi:uncharacterized protein YwqG
MAIGFRLKKTERILFCASKWWGDPDFPEHMEYPTVKVKDEDGSVFDYPLTFICQINCEDIAQYDEEGKLPHEGMLYFFGAIDEYLGYGSYTHNGSGEWPKGEFVVKYAKSVNFETFQSCILVDDEDNSLTEPEMEMEFFECAEDDMEFKILGTLVHEEVCGRYPEHTSLLQLINSSEAGTDFGENGTLNVMIKDSDLKYGNWKKSKAVLHTL